MRKFGSFLLGVFLGGVVGSVAALLLAPASGENARSEIKNYFSHIIEEINNAADEKRAELERELQKLRSGEKAKTEEPAS